MIAPLLLLLFADFAELFNAGLSHYQQQRFAQARPLFAEAAKLNPKDFNAHFLLGASCSRLGAVDDALRAWRSADALNPKNARLLQLMTVEYGKGRYFTEALAAARRALELLPNDPAVHFLAIKAAQDLGDLDTALTVARQAATKFPDQARANFEYGFLLQKHGQLEDSARYLKRSMELDPKYEEPFFFQGDSLVKQGLSEQAIPLLRQAIANRHDYVPARVTLARALVNLERWDEALAELEETVRLDPKHPQPHLLLSQIYFRRGDEARAQQEKALSLKLRRENPTVLEAVQSRPFRDR